MPTEMTLYTINGSCSDAVVALCAHLGLPVELRERRDHDADLATVNPGRTVPTLVTDEGLTLTETTAILNHLARSFAAEMLGRTPAMRARNDEMLSFLATSVYNAFLLRFRPDRSAEDPAAQQAVRAMSDAEIAKALDMLETRVSNQTFALGENLTSSDFFLLVMLNWADRIDGRLLRSRPKLAAHFEALKEMPFHARAFGAQAA
ncbi:MAG: glutathione S-transferase family protein [Roseicyclus sp.]|nr:glutathione S-transferase family protein [Roseicyclus sp.]MBO6623402.1 glutathione S-transferase family protein [Roseicyclus sp.]MBO6920738.1 glutathione S-transferase family protein [Roseicyclus sp.]